MNAFSWSPQVLLISGTLLYGVTLIVSLFTLFGKTSQKQTTFYPLLAAGFFAQSVGLYWRTTIIQGVPITNLFEILQLIAWTSILLVFVVRLHFEVHLLGFFGNALAFILSLSSILLPDLDLPHNSSFIEDSPWIPLHALLSILSYGVFGILAIMALMYILQDYGLSHKRYSGFFSRLPAIRQIDTISTLILVLGVILFSLAILLGAPTWIHNSHMTDWAKIIPAWTLWIAYIILLTLKKLEKLIPKQFAWTAFCLFIFALFILWPIVHNNASPCITSHNHTH